ncbi:MAG: hypothetical protein AB1758_19095 [Candidatus Eremiobacterota bacterium]
MDSINLPPAPFPQPGAAGPAGPAQQSPQPAGPNQGVASNPMVPIEARQSADQILQGFQNFLLPGNQANLGPLMNKTIGELTDEELDKAFGQDAQRVKDLAFYQPRLTVSEVIPLRQDPQAMDEIFELLSSRSDLKMDDIVSKDSKGNLVIDPAVRDPASRDLMINRADLKPAELTAMRQSFAADLKQPALAAEAYKVSIDLLKTRTDVRPQDLSQMMTRIMRGVGGASGQDPSNAAAALDMFKTGVKLMKSRPDIMPHDVGRLALAVANLGGKQDGKSGMKVAMAFSQAADFLMTRPGSNVNEVITLAGAIRQRMPGEGGADSDDRMTMFGMGLQLMQDVPALNGAGVAAMMQKAAEGPPPRQGANLLNAFRTMSGNVMNGRASLGMVTDTVQRPDPKQRGRLPGEVVMDQFGREIAPVEPPPGVPPGQVGTQEGQPPQAQPGIPREFIPRPLRVR